jgi:CheY-like chemotaxis protein
MILIVEDNGPNLALLQAALTLRHHEIGHASTIQEAREWLETHAPSMILLDYRLPDGEGLEVARLVRARPDLRDVPIFLISATVHETVERAARAAGCNDFISKPIDLRALYRRIEAALPQASP